ncbi:MAG: L-seryl-tRNA(Sec) selenium transferase, partial [Burkholderiaceae bacterium]|nr:L-seryl-tRNA(Sec) selenium transferase [Burkholderiaceae bacterium]
WSNYAITGFTATVDDSTLAQIAHQRNVPYMVDLGAGALVDLSAYGLPREPMPQESLAAGADVVTFSGDKLLGGPQAGLIVGRRDAIARINKDPLKRVLRVSKLTMAALEATLRIYASGHRLEERLPTLERLARRQADIRLLGERIAMAITAALAPAFVVTLEDCASQVGSGSMPTDRLPSAAIVIRPHGKVSGRIVERLQDRLRALPTPIIGRIADGALWLDLRCLMPRDEAAFIANLASL